MEVNYNEIRENVIAKMMEHASTMVVLLEILQRATILREKLQMHM